MRNFFLFSVSLLAVALFHSTSAAQSDITALWKHPPRAPRHLPFTAFVADLDQAPLERDEAVAQDPLVPEIQPAEPIAAKPAPFPATVPSVIAEPSAGIGFLIAGVAGWILLTISFLVLVGRKTPQTKS